MKVTLENKEHTLKFDNYALHEWAELCGFETLNEALEGLQGFVSVANGEPITIKQSKNLARLCYVCLGGEIEEREVYNLVFSNPTLVQNSMIVALDSLPKPHKEDTIKSDEKKKVVK